MYSMYVYYVCSPCMWSMYVFYSQYVVYVFCVKLGGYSLSPKGKTSMNNATCESKVACKFSPVRFKTQKDLWFRIYVWKYWSFRKKTWIYKTKKMRIDALIIFLIEWRHKVLILRGRLSKHWSQNNHKKNKKDAPWCTYHFSYWMKTQGAYFEG